jgi:NAD(P)-dependent dehydrogenase (short-subunit alcohol dehydrogenase family)
VGLGNVTGRDRWRTTIDTNLTSSFLVTLEYLKQLKTASMDAKKNLKAPIIFMAGKYGDSFYYSLLTWLTNQFISRYFLYKAKLDTSISTMQLPIVVRIIIILHVMSQNIQTNFLAMMFGLTMSLKNEIVKIAPKGRVKCIGPGWVRTIRVPPQTPSSYIIFVRFSLTRK